MQHTLTGTLKKNTRGRCCLIIRGNNSPRKIFRLREDLPYAGGQLVTLTGYFSENRFCVEKAVPHRLPRKNLKQCRRGS